MNAFLDLAEQQIAAPVKSRQRATEKRTETHARKAADEQRTCLKEWHAWRRDRIKALLAGPHGEAAQALVAFLDKMTLEQAPSLITLVEQGPWRGTDHDTRHQILSLVGTAIVRLRERNGLTPFDDSLPGEPPTAYEIVRELLR